MKFVICIADFWQLFQIGTCLPLQWHQLIDGKVTFASVCYMVETRMHFCIKCAFRCGI
jgi:hypothetical protein